MFPRPKDAQEGQELEEEILSSVADAALDDVNDILEKLPEKVHKKLIALGDEYGCEPEVVVVQYLDYLTSAYIAATSNLASFTEEESGKPMNPELVLEQALGNFKKLVGDHSANEILRSVTYHTDSVLDAKYGTQLH